MPIRLLSGLLLSACLIWPVLATPAKVKIASLGTPACVDKNPYPDTSYGWFDYRLRGDDGDVLSPWDYSGLAKFALYSALLTVGQGTNPGPVGVIYRFPSPQTSVKFLIGNPSKANRFIFKLNKQKVADTDGSAIVAALGPAKANDYYVQLSVIGSATFDEFEMYVPGSSYFQTLTFADFNVSCP